MLYCLQRYRLVVEQNADLVEPFVLYRMEPNDQVVTGKIIEFRFCKDLSRISLGNLFLCPLWVWRVGERVHFRQSLRRFTAILIFIKSEKELFLVCIWRNLYRFAVENREAMFRHPVIDQRHHIAMDIFCGDA